MTQQRAFMSAVIMMAIEQNLLPIDSLVGMFNTVTEAVSTNGPSDALDALIGAVGKVKQEMGDPYKGLL